MLSVTVGDRGVALVKKFRYLRAKVSWTGSFISIVTWGSRLGSGKAAAGIPDPWDSSGKGHQCCFQGKAKTGGIQGLHEPEGDRALSLLTAGLGLSDC